MEQVAAVEECFAVGAEEMVAHSEEVVTSTEPVISTPPRAPQQLQTSTLTGYIPVVASPVMQVVTLQTVQQTSPQPGLTNSLRNIRLIAIQPRPLLNGTKVKPISLQPKPDVKVQSQVVDTNEARKVAVTNFYSKLKSSPILLAPKMPTPQQVAPKPIAKKPPPHIKPSPSYYKEQQREREMKDFSHLNEELSRGVRILLDLTTSLHHGTTWPFMERVDPVKDGAPDYEQVVETPMWLSKIKEKFRKNEYSSIKEFVADMRLVFENCYRYNGPNHPVTKKALRLEQSFEQKLALLPTGLKEACALEETEEERNARPTSSEAFFSVLHHRFKNEREKREQLAREKKEEELRKRREEKERQRALWAERMMNPQVKARMKCMWEIPQLGHFLHLARGALHIGEIAQYELEHMFLMPEASNLLATLMTSLLSSPNQRAKLAESPPTPYSVWSTRLSGRVGDWYRTYNRELHNFVKVHETLGIEPMFWRVCGDSNPLDNGKKYHELSFLKRVWIFKGLCDSVAHLHKTVQEAMAEEEGPESRQVNLGTDSNGYTYLHFPAVSGSDIRVYRQKMWDVDEDPIWAPIVAQRKVEEEERALEEERRAEEMRRKKRATAAASKRTPNKKTPAKKKGGTRTPSQSTPTPQRKSERPQRLGTRISPRTIQRQTGYKDTSSESEQEDEEQQEEEEEDEEEVPKSDEEVSESEKSIDKTPEVVKKPAKRRRGGRWSSRKRPVKKKLQKIEEEPETKEENRSEEPRGVDVKEEKMDVSDSEKSNDKHEENGDQIKVTKEADVKEEVDQVKKEDVEMKEEVDKGEQEDAEVKEEAVQEEVNEPPAQRFTVSQLIQKISEEETTEEVPPKTEGAPPKTEEEETIEKKDDVGDPERSSYDPFFFELIISSVEQLQEWINKFTDPPANERDDEDEPRKRPRCEIKLRERLQALLDEAKPLAADQHQANEKICHQLWKEWDRYRSSDAAASRDDGETNSQELDALTDSELVDEPMDESISDSDDEGVRKSRRLRTKRGRQPANGSTRSSSPVDDEPSSTKQSRKGNYGYDPAWDSDNSTELPGKRRSNFVPEMKNPEFWVGRRVTRATAAFVEPDESCGTDPPQADDSSSPTEVTNDNNPTISPAKTEQLIDQLRQLRRQQALLSSNDPKPVDKSSSSLPSVFLPSKDGSLVRITNPRAAELLSRIKKPSAAAAGASPRKIVIQIKANGGNPTSVDISHLIHRAAEQGLIVPDEPRSFSIDLDEHGKFLVKAQMTPAGPKVLGAAPIRKCADSAPVESETSEAPEKTCDAPNNKQVLVNDPRQNNVISQELLQQVAGEEAVGAKLTIVKEGNAKVLTLILANGEMRRLTTSQVQQIQAAVRNKTKPAAPSSSAS